MKKIISTIAILFLINTTAAFASAHQSEIRKVAVHYNGKIVVEPMNQPASPCDEFYVKPDIDSTARIMMLKVLMAAKLTGKSIFLDYDNTTDCNLRRVIDNK